MRHGVISSSTAARSRSGCAAAVIAPWFWPLNVIGWVCSGGVTRLGAVLDMWWIRTREVSLAKRVFQTPTPPHRKTATTFTVSPRFAHRPLSSARFQMWWWRENCGTGVDMIDLKLWMPKWVWNMTCGSIGSKDMQCNAVDAWCTSVVLNSVIEKHKQVKLVLFKTQVSFYWASHDSSINPFTDSSPLLLAS